MQPTSRSRSFSSRQLPLNPANDLGGPKLLCSCAPRPPEPVSRRQTHYRSWQNLGSPSPRNVASAASRHAGCQDIAGSRLCARVNRNYILNLRLGEIVPPLPNLRSLSDGDFNLRIAARRNPVQGRNNPVNVAAQDGPLGVSKNDDGDFPARQVLLIPYVFVGCHKYFEGRGLGGIK